MYYELYIDVFFAENMMLDYLILLITGCILRRKGRTGRLLIASIAGAAGACITVVSPFRHITVISVAGYLMLAFLMVGVSFGVSERKMLLQAVLCFGLVALLMGGVFEALASQFRFSMPVLAFGSAGILTALLRGYRSTKFRTQNFYEIILGFQGKSVCVKGLRDTGNRLNDPLTGKPVSIISYDTAKILLDKNVKIFYIPYHSIGKSSGLLPGVRLDYMDIRRENGLQRLESPIIAVSSEPVSREGRYQMILHPALID